MKRSGAVVRIPTDKDIPLSEGDYLVLVSTDNNPLALNKDLIRMTDAEMLAHIEHSKRAGRRALLINSVRRNMNPRAVAKHYLVKGA
jgi:hypothetical protein